MLKEELNILRKQKEKLVKEEEVIKILLGKEMMLVTNNYILGLENINQKSVCVKYVKLNLQKICQIFLKNIKEILMIFGGYVKNVIIIMIAEVRMKFWKDKKGNALDSKEFLHKWKKGIQSITPLQQASIVYKNSWVMIIGILAGIIFTLFNLKQLWWLTIILAAAFVNTLIVQLGNWQKYKMLKSLEGGNDVQ